MADQARTITLDGIQYAVDQFSPGVQQAVDIYNAFNVDLQKAQLEVLKNQSAMQAVGAQISSAVQKELAEKKAAAEAPANTMHANEAVGG